MINYKCNEPILILVFQESVAEMVFPPGWSGDATLRKGCASSRLFLRNNIALPLPIFMAPGITDIINDGETLEIDYARGLVRNPATGASVALRKFPPMIERVFECGGLPELARQRHRAEIAGRAQDPHCDSR